MQMFVFNIKEAPEAQIGGQNKHRCRCCKARSSARCKRAPWQPHARAKKKVERSSGMSSSAAVSTHHPQSAVLMFVSAILVGDLRLERRRKSVNWERDSHIATSSSAVDETVRAPPSGSQKSFPWLEQNQFHTTRASDDSIR